MVRRASLLSLTLLLMAATACTRHTDASTVRVMAAASLVDLMKAVQPQALDVRATFGASSQLRAEVERGAPADVIITASADDIRKLRDKNLVIPETARILYRNHLVLVAPVDGTIKSLDQLKQRGRIGIGDPKTVPAGKYAEQSLRKLGMWDATDGRRVVGPDVRVVLGWVAKGEVDAAIVYDTDRRAEEKRVHVVATLPDDSHDPILYVGAVPTSSANRAGAEAFLKALNEPAALKEAAAEGFEPVMEPLPK